MYNFVAILLTVWKRVDVRYFETKRMKDRARRIRIRQRIWPYVRMKLESVRIAPILSVVYDILVR